MNLNEIMYAQCQPVSHIFRFKTLCSLALQSSLSVAMANLEQVQNKNVNNKDAMKQTSLPWSKDTSKSSSSDKAEDLSKCRVVHVTKQILLKAAASHEFMVLKSNNVRTVAVGCVVRVVLLMSDDAVTTTSSPVVATAEFCGNVKITAENQSQYSHLHITSQTDFELMNDKGNVIGWTFKKLSLLPAIEWVVGSTRKDCIIVLYVSASSCSKTDHDMKVHWKHLTLKKCFCYYIYRLSFFFRAVRYCYFTLW